VELPEFILGMHELDIPFPPEIAKTHALRSERGLFVIIEVFQDISLPAHSHLGQWGTVVEGCVELTMDGQTKAYKPGESYNILAGVEHAAKVYAGSKVIEVFEEPDRYPLRG
jgi:quercetin dioxygenase-like cupin family protein